MREYERSVGPNQKATIRGTRCDVCGFTLLEKDDDV
jgi:predicted HNH restriction endonuclease